MTTINMELYEALKLAKVPEKKARAAAENLVPHPDTTETDIQEIKADIKAVQSNTRWLQWGVGIAIVLNGISIAAVVTVLALMASGSS